MMKTPYLREVLRRAPSLVHEASKSQEHQEVHDFPCSAHLLHLAIVEGHDGEDLGIEDMGVERSVLFCSNCSLQDT